MTRSAKFLCTTLGLVLPMAASANELAPLQSGTFELRDHTASVYYTVQSDSFQVVATIAHTGGDGAPARFVAQLMPGQTATVAVGAFDTSAPPAVLELKRNGDLLYAEVVPVEHLASK